RGGEATGDRLVLAVQEVDAEAAGLAKRRIALALMVDADQHERRIERDRREGAGGETCGAEVGVAGRHDRDAGREVSEATTKIVGGNHRSYIASGSDECKEWGGTGFTTGANPVRSAPAWGEGV